MDIIENIHDSTEAEKNIKQNLIVRRIKAG